MWFPLIFFFSLLCFETIDKVLGLFRVFSFEICSTFSYVFLVLTFFFSLKRRVFLGGGDSSNTRLQHALIHEFLEQAHFLKF